MWPKGGRLCQKITAFNSRVRELRARAWEDKVVEATLIKDRNSKFKAVQLDKVGRVKAY